MNENSQRQIERDSLFLMAELRVDGAEDVHSIRVRNLSAGGMMGEGLVRIARDTRVVVNLRNIGWVAGSVAWVQDNRFGVAFREEINPKRVREQLEQEGEHTPRFAKPPLAPPPGPDRLRKI